MSKRKYKNGFTKQALNNSCVRFPDPSNLVLGVADKQIILGLSLHFYLGPGVQDEKLGGGFGETGTDGDLGRQDDGAFDAGRFDVIKRSS